MSWTSAPTPLPEFCGAAARRASSSTASNATPARTDPEIDMAAPALINGTTRAAQKALLRSLRVTRRLVRPHRKKPGSPPGTLVHTGERRVENARLHLIRYGPDGIEERDIASPVECLPSNDHGTVTWLDITGIHDAELLSQVGRLTGMHPLLLEDVMSTRQRPKQEEYEQHHFLVLRMLRFDSERNEVSEEQISVVVGTNYVISFQEAEGDVWEPVRERLRAGKGLIRNRGPDYLAYTLLDSVVDGYFGVVESIGDQLELLESEVMQEPTRATITRIYQLKGELLIARKAVWPLRDLFNSLVRDESRLFTDSTKLFLRDAYDHSVQVIDSVETMRDLSASLVDLYLSSVSNRMNEVMKVLTLIATIFIPLTFIVGVYGMNFDFMPELHWRWSYPVIWGVMIVLGMLLMLYFRKRRWL
jgi:magnesium transporter